MNFTRGPFFALVVHRRVDVYAPRSQVRRVHGRDLVLRAVADEDHYAEREAAELEPVHHRGEVRLVPDGGHVVLVVGDARVDALQEDVALVEEQDERVVLGLVPSHVDVVEGL